MIDHTNKQFESLADTVATDPVVEANRELLLQRSKLGISKYGATLAGAGLSRKEILRHALEEALDLANYLQTELMAGPAIANKAAEEGGLSEFDVPMDDALNEAGWIFVGAHQNIMGCNPEAFNHIKPMLKLAIEAWLAHPESPIKAIAADRASRQVANKAEVEPVAFMTSDKKMLVFADAMRKLQFDPAGMVALCEYPPATTGASTAPRPTDDELWDATLRDRDAYHEWADKLADAIAKHFGVDIGEHSNQNLPWDEALQAIENAEPVGASTVLTDEQIADIWADVHVKHETGCRIHFARAIEREVAAQASQAAVPESLQSRIEAVLQKAGPMENRDATVQELVRELSK